MGFAPAPHKGLVPWPIFGALPRTPHSPCGRGSRSLWVLLPDGRVWGLHSVKVGSSGIPPRQSLWAYPQSLSWLHSRPFNPIGIEKPLERRKIDSRGFKSYFRVTVCIRLSRTFARSSCSLFDNTIFAGNSQYSWLFPQLFHTRFLLAT